MQISVRTSDESLFRALKHHLSGSLSSILVLYQLFLSALLDYFVGQTEPKILPLVSSVGQNYPPACVTL